MAGLTVQSAEMTDEPSLCLSYIRSTLKKDDPASTMEVYAKLAKQVWSMLVERRLDDGLRDWHHLLQSTKSYVRGYDPLTAERFVALSDLVRESITAAESSPAKDIAQRPQARRILKILRQASDFVSRQQLLEETQLKGSNLTNILSKLAVHGLVERRDEGKRASFKITRLGAEAYGVPLAEAVNDTMPTEKILAVIRGIIGENPPKTGWPRLRHTEIEDLQIHLPLKSLSEEVIEEGRSHNYWITNVFGNKPRYIGYRDEYRYDPVIARHVTQRTG